MNSSINNVNGARKHNKLAVWLAAAAGLVGVAMIPSTASAGHRDDDRWDRRDRRDWRDDRFDRRHGHVDLHVGIRRDDCEPAKVWHPAEVRYEQERVWIPPVYKDVCEKVWIPARHEVRERVVIDRHGCRKVVREEVCVEPGRWVEQHRKVLVCEGRWEVQERKVVLRDGHWHKVDHGHAHGERLDLSFGYRR